jgi:hypothetical protein
MILKIYIKISRQSQYNMIKRLKYHFTFPIEYSIYMWNIHDMFRLYIAIIWCYVYKLFTELLILLIFNDFSYDVLTCDTTMNEETI